MTRRAWLRHPAQTIHPPPPCPTGLPRYSNPDHAGIALNYGLAETNLATLRCPHGCGGWHNIDIATLDAGDCDPTWTGPTPLVTTVTLHGSYL
jgi:hypothetical protein